MKMSDPVLTCYDLSPRVVAFSTTRHGGQSTGRYASFNINRYCGDEAAHVAANRRALASLLGVPEQHIVMPHQTHGKKVQRVDLPPTEVIEATDAVMTNVSGLCIGVSTADCIPIIIYDPVSHAACAVHAGWRGTVQRIVREAVRSMHDAYGSEPSHLKAVVGPGIGLESFEVGDEVYQQFQEAGFDMSSIARRYEKWHIDLPLCNQRQLQESGVTDILMTGIDTYQRCDDYFSARRLGVNSGRIYTAILLK